MDTGSNSGDCWRDPEVLRVLGFLWGLGFGVGIGAYRPRGAPHHRGAVSSSLLGPVDPSFRAPSGRLKFTVRRHKFNQDSLPWGVGAPLPHDLAAHYVAEELVVRGLSAECSGVRVVMSIHCSLVRAFIVHALQRLLFIS